MPFQKDNPFKLKQFMQFIKVFARMLTFIARINN